MSVTWRDRSRVFDERAAEYDGWFDSSRVFELELSVLKAVRAELAGPRCEIGVGPGRFAVALGVGLGVDPALGALGHAAARGIAVCRGVGEALPLATASLGTIYLLFTLCFLDEPGRVLAEIHRCLRAGGHLVLGMINGASPWGELLAAKKDSGHPFYRHARFYERVGVEKLLAAAGFAVVEEWSGLLSPPEAAGASERPRAGSAPEAGFLVLVCRRNGAPAGRG